MSPRDRTTIAALCTPPGAAERAALRISGPDAGAIVRALVRVDGRPPDLARRGFARGRFHDGRGEQPVLLLWMPAPASFTREDVAELHLPGAPALALLALARVLALGAAPAAPGEFTRRAFENGRIDLTQAEGVLELVLARSDEEARAAGALLFGGLGERTAALRDGLEDLRALCEASLDFHERDTGHVDAAELAARARAVLAELDLALAWEERRAAPALGARVVIAGSPNAGKSSLFNALVRGEALVSPLPGTTRDPLTAPWRPGGVACTLADTAGLAAAGDEPARAAQEHARAEIAGADLVLWTVDASTARPATLADEAAALAGAGALLLAWNKVDLPGAPPAPSADALAAGGAPAWVAVSAASGAGLGELAARAAALLAPERAAPATGFARELSQRHRAALAVARAELILALGFLEGAAPLDLAAEALRAATDALDSIAGRTTPEDLLERIFARFCIGK